MKISAVVLTKNSERTVEKCLSSLRWCNEIIIIDDNSTDNTLQIAKKHTLKIFKNSLSDNFSKQRNFGLEKTTGDWILFVDSDEYISPSLSLEIQKITKNPFEGYYIRRIDTMWRKKLKHGETGNIWLLRLGRKSGKWEGKVHEVWNIEGKIGYLKNPIDHFPHPTVNDFLSKVNFYSTLYAQELYEKGERISFLDIIIYPKVKFYVNYFLKLGFLDGIPGLIVAIMMSFHSFLVRGKLWQMQKS